MGARYAIFFAPDAGSAFWRFGASWLGRDVETGQTLDRPALNDAWSALELDALTASPRLYGFHGTLKPPFRLAPDCSIDALLDAVEAFAHTQAPFACPDIEVAALGHFIAFRPRTPFPALNALAAECVRTFDPFRAALNPSELAKRRKAGLTDRQEQRLQRWGYPYVFDEFRFHMTLTGAIEDAAMRNRLTAQLRAAAEAAGATGAMQVNEIAVYEQPEAGAPFRLLRRVPFQA